MSQLIALKSRIQSIKKTSKITHAMRLMAMSTYAKLEGSFSGVDLYTKTMRKLYAEASHYLPEWNNPIFLPKDHPHKRSLVILIMSSKGLCGSFNSNLGRFFMQQNLARKNPKTCFISIGEKAHLFLKAKDYGTILKHYPQLSITTSTIIAHSIIDIIMNASETFSSVTLLSNHFKNFFVQNPQKEILIPLTKDTNLLKPPTLPLFQEEPLWEIQPKATLDGIALCYLKSLLINHVLNSLLAEQAARFLAMDNSTNNAERYLDKLNLHFNKSRQGLITCEVAELSSCFSQDELH